MTVPTKSRDSLSGAYKSLRRQSGPPNGLSGHLTTVAWIVERSERRLYMRIRRVPMWRALKMLTVALCLLAVVAVDRARAAEQGNGDKASSETLMAELTPFGFRPDRLTYDPAKRQHYIVIQAFVGRVAVRLGLLSSDGTERSRRDLAGQRRVWTERVTLDGGTYTLVDRNHPEWAMTISPRGK